MPPHRGKHASSASRNTASSSNGDLTDGKDFSVGAGGASNASGVRKGRRRGLRTHPDPAASNTAAATAGFEGRPERSGSSAAAPLVERSPAEAAARDHRRAVETG